MFSFGIFVFWDYGEILEVDCRLPRECAASATPETGNLDREMILFGNFVFWDYVGILELECTSRGLRAPEAIEGR